jgi:hypothetical protein
MNKNGLLICYDKDLRLHVNYPEARKEITNDVVRFIRKAPGMNFVSFTFADCKKIERVVDSEVDYLAPLQQPFTWKAYEHDCLPNLRNALLANGFVGDNDPAAVGDFALHRHCAGAFLYIYEQPASTGADQPRDGGDRHCPAGDIYQPCYSTIHPGCSTSRDDPASRFPAANRACPAHSNSGSNRIADSIHTTIP